MQKFLSEIAEILEVDAVPPDLRFRTVDDWDSMKGFSIIVMMERDYNKVMTVPEFMACETVSDLAKYAGVEL